jgi:hypothetical protein
MNLTRIRIPVRTSGNEKKPIIKMEDWKNGWKCRTRSKKKARWKNGTCPPHAGFDHDVLQLPVPSTPFADLLLPDLG